MKGIGSNTRLLITGGYGFIGSNFVRHILNKYDDYTILNLDAFTYAANVKNLMDTFSVRHASINGDICHDLSRYVSEVDVVINFAAETHVDRSIQDCTPFVHTNILGVKNILENIVKYNKKLIHISTDEVYGAANNQTFTEKYPVNPKNPYSATKASADLLIQSFINTHKAQVMIVRPSNNYGPRQYPEKLIPFFIKQLLRGERVPVYGNGKQIREWTLVNDTCRAIDLLLHHGKYGEIYNVTSGHKEYNIDVARKLLKYLDKPKNMIKHVEDRLGHDKCYSISADKIKKQCNWKAEIDFDNGLKATIFWYLANANWRFKD